MSDLREKVAEKVDDWIGDIETSRDIADAAIAAVLDALKEPTPLMISAAVEAGERSGYTDIVAVHQAMIEAFARDYYLSAMAEEDGREL